MKLHNQQSIEFLSTSGMISCVVHALAYTDRGCLSDERAPEVLARAFLVLRDEEVRSGRHEFI